MIRTSLSLARIGGLVAVFLAVLGGMALVTGTGVIVESGLRSSVTAQRLVHADLVVAARQSLPRKEDLPVALPERATVPTSLVTRLTRVPGVASAVGDLSFPAADIAGPSTGDPAAAGHGWSSVELAGRVWEGRPPAGPGEVALPRGRLGDEVRLVVAGRPGTYRVTALVDAPGMYFADAVAAELRGKANTVDLVALRLAPGTSVETVTERLAGLLGERYQVAAGRFKGDAEAPGTAAARGLLVALAGSIGGISLLVVGFVVGGTLSLAVNGQRRDLALLRAAGATPRQVRRLVAIQGFAAAGAGMIPGAFLGYYLAGRFGDLLVAKGVLPAELPLTYGPLPAVAAVLLLAGVVRVAAWTAALRVSRISPVAGVAESRSEPREPSRARTGAGLLLMLAAGVLSMVPLLLRSEVAVIGPANAALLAVIGLALAGPRLVQMLTGLLAERLPDRASAMLWLAVRNTRGYALRTAGAIAALGMVVSLGVSFTYSQTTVMAAKADEVAAGLRGLRVVTAAGLGGIPHGLAAELRAVPGVSGVAEVATTSVLTRGLAFGDEPGLDVRTAMVLGPDADGLVGLDVAGGSLGALRGPAIALDARLGQVGDTRELVMGDGVPVKARVVATYRRALGFGPVVVSRDLAAGHTTTGLASAILVRPAGANVDAVLARWPGTRPSPGLPWASAGSVPAEVVVNLVVLFVLLGYVLVAVANRLVVTTIARRAEFRALRRLGATPGQLARMVRWEALVIAVLAAGSGLALSAVPLGMLSVGFLGRPWPAGPWWAAPAFTLMVAAVVWLAYALTTRRRGMAGPGPRRG